MKRLAVLLLLAAAPAWAQLPAPGEPGAIDDPRYCGEPERDEHGVIKRDPAVLREFVKVFPCPLTLLHKTSCKRFQINHQLPLAAGGCHSVANLWWMPVAIKVCRKDAPWNIDCWERKYHAIPRRAVRL